MSAVAVRDKHSHAVPLLPRDFDDRTRDMSDEDRDALRRKLQSDFVKAKGQWVRLMRKDRTQGFNRTAKLIAAFLMDSLNFETGRCFPSHEVIADELGISERTVERNVKRIISAGWVQAHRARRNMPTFYSFHAPEEKVKRILDMHDALQQSREERREDRRYTRTIDHAPTVRPDTFVGTATIRPDTFVQSDPTLLTGEHKKGTSEDWLGTDVEGYTLRSPSRDVPEINAYARAKGGM